MIKTEFFAYCPLNLLALNVSNIVRILNISLVFEVGQLLVPDIPGEGGTYVLRVTVTVPP